MSDTVIRVYVYDRNERPIPGAEVTWTVKHGGMSIECGPATTQGFADKPVDIQIEGELEEPFVDITARFENATKTERIPTSKRDHTIKLDVALPEPANPALPPQSIGQTPMPQPLSATWYAIISFLGLAGSIVIGWYLLTNPGLLAPNNASARAYYVLLLLLGLSSAAFLFGAMRSTAALKGTHIGAVYEFGGPVVVAIIVVWGGFELTKPGSEFALTVRLRAAEPISGLTDSWVRVTLDGLRLREQLSGDGQVSIRGIPARFLDAEIPVELESKTYRLTDPVTVYKVPTNAVINLDVIRITGGAESGGSRSYARLLERCTESIQATQYDIALERCAQAAAEHKEDFKPVHLLGLAQYHSGYFAQAINSFEAALKLPGADTPMILYNLAFAQSQHGEHRGALKSLELAAGAAIGRPVLLARIWFAIASLKEMLWQESPADISLFEGAVKAYKIFLEVGTPTFWAHGHLACMHAIRAMDSDQSATKAGLERVVATELEIAVSELLKFNRPNVRAVEVVAFLRKFGGESKSKCAAAMAAAWANQRPDLNRDYLAALR